MTQTKIPSSDDKIPDYRQAGNQSSEFKVQKK